VMRVLGIVGWPTLGFECRWRDDKIDFRGCCGIIWVSDERGCFEESSYFIFGSGDFILSGRGCFCQVVPLFPEKPMKKSKNSNQLCYCKDSYSPNGEKSEVRVP